MSHYLLYNISRKFYTKSNILSSHLLYEACDRFASYILAITFDEYGECIQSHITKKEINDIAEFIGITPRHLNRIIQRYIEEVILERTEKGFNIIDIDKLMKQITCNIYEIQ